MTDPQTVPAARRASPRRNHAKGRKLLIRQSPTSNHSGAVRAGDELPRLYESLPREIAKEKMLDDDRRAIRIFFTGTNQKRFRFASLQGHKAQNIIVAGSAIENICNVPLFGASEYAARRR